MSAPPHTSWPPIAPVDVELVSGDARLAVDLRGGGIRALSVAGWDVVDGYASGAVPSGRRGGLLLPWPNRLRNGRWSWAGRELQLDVSSAEKPNAMHGLLSWQPFAVLSRFSDAVTVGRTLEP